MKTSHKKPHTGGLTAKIPGRPHARDSIYTTLETSNHSLPLRNLTPETSLQKHLIRKPSLQTSLYLVLETSLQRLQMHHIRNLSPQTLIEFFFLNKAHLRDLTPETSLEKQRIRNRTPPTNIKPHGRDLTTKTLGTSHHRLLLKTSCRRPHCKNIILHTTGFTLQTSCQRLLLKKTFT